MIKCLVLFLSSVAAPVWAGTATVTIDAAKAGPKVNPRMYGIFLEEINYGVDGGLYAELVANRASRTAVRPRVSHLRQAAIRTLKVTTRATKFATARCRGGSSCARTEPRAPFISKPPAG